MKNSLRCVFGLLDSVKIREIGTVFSEKGEYWKECLYEPHALPSNPWQSKRTCLKILKICQITKFDMDRRFSQTVE
jgi:hypothetical protein